MQLKRIRATVYRYQYDTVKHINSHNVKVMADEEPIGKKFY